MPILQVQEAFTAGKFQYIYISLLIMNRQDHP
jgi:hypothetical protein